MFCRNLKNPVKLLVFDWDGTLANTTHLIVDAMMHAIEQLQLPLRSEQQIRDIIGLGLNEAATTLYPMITEADMFALLDAYRGNYLQNARGRTSLFPDVLETLEYFRSKNIYLAVATGKSRKGLNNSMNETGLNNYFNSSRCADETFSKPHPQMLLEIMDELDVAAEQTLMVGDSIHDVMMAHNANVGCFAVTSGTQTRTDLEKLKPLGIIDTVNELCQ